MKLKHTITPHPSQNEALLKAVSTLLGRLKAVRPYGADLASLLTQVLLQLDPTLQIAADSDACVEPDEDTSWRSAEKRLAPFLNLDKFRTVDGHAGDLRTQVQQLRGAYMHILGTDDGPDRGAFRALDRLVFNDSELSKMFSPA